MEKTELRRHAHPMPGWVALYPIDPDKREGARGRTSAIELPGIGGLLIHEVEVSLDENVRAGIVMEIGQIPSGAPVDQDEVIPYPIGATAFYPSDRGIEIGDYVYLSAQNVIAWEEAPE